MSEYRKAIFAGLAAGLAALGTALTDGTVTTAEWAIVAGAAVAAASTVWAIPNTSTSGSR